MTTEMSMKALFTRRTRRGRQGLAWTIAIAWLMALGSPGLGIASPGPSTSKADHRQMAERYYSRFQQPDFDVDELMEFYDDDVRFSDPTFEITARGDSEVRKLYADIGTDRTSYTNITWTLDRIVVESDDVVIHGRWAGEFSGCTFDVPFVTLWRLRNGLIAEQTDFFAAAIFDRQVNWNSETQRAECGKQ